MDHSIKSWPADRVERKSVASLVPYANNARMHSDAQIAQVARSIEQYGFTVPVLIDDNGGIIAGHCRVLAAKQLGLAEVPVMTATGWSDAERRAYIIIDNKLALNAEWNDAALRVEFADLEATGFDLTNLGFDPLELKAIRHGGTTGLTDPDEAPQAPQEPVCAPGDVWLLGGHRLVCGDSTQSVAVSAAMNGAIPHLMVTDPPYGVDFDPTWRKGSENREYMGDKPDKEYIWKEAWNHFGGDVCYIWLASSKLKNLWITLEDEIGFDLRSLIIWNKMRFIIGRGHYCWNHECCYYGVRDGKTAHWQGARDQPTVWDIKHLASDTNHGAQKPVECMRRPIENNSAPGDAVYDPFVGSGTTIIAAEMTGRVCHAIEINPAYCDVTIMRWQNFTGKKAQREDGKSFEWNGMWRKPFDRPELLHGPETIPTN